MSSNSISIRRSRLIGNIRISGSKNASLPIIIASLLSNKVVLKNIPTKLLDIENICEILQAIGSSITVFGDCLDIDNNGVNNFNISTDLINKTRASLWFLVPMLIKLGEINLPMPGGCKLNTGPRMINFHIDLLKQMGANIKIKDGIIHASLKDKVFTPTSFIYPNISVGATITGILAGVHAAGETYLYNCAREPEVVDLCNFLISLGADIRGIGTDELIINGITKLNQSTQYSVISDRIEACTYIFAAAATDGDITLTNIDPILIENLDPIFRDIGIEIEYQQEFVSSLENTQDSEQAAIELDKESVEQDAEACGIDHENTDYIPSYDEFNWKPDSANVNSITLIRAKRNTDRLFGIDISTGPYPEFPTDLQPIIMSILTIADGESNIYENLFDNRFTHAKELKKMGANISLINKQHALITPVGKLRATTIEAENLRSAASLIIAGLIADSTKGPTVIKNAYHIHRGYEDLIMKLRACGADIEEHED